MMRLLKLATLLAVCALVSIPAMSAAEDKAGGFEFHGYMRAGFDFNTNIANPESDDLRLKQLPTDFHSRFGNEGNRSYIEPSFQYTWREENKEEFWKMVLTFSTFYNEGANDAGDTFFRNREAYIQGGGFDFMPSMKVWAGNRYYGREYVPELDWFFTNLIGWGAGVEDIALGKSKLNVAWIAVHHGLGAWEANNLIYEDETLEEKVGEMQENNFDFSFHSIPLSDDLIMKLEASFKYIKGGYISLDSNGDNIDDFTGKVDDQLGYFGLAKLDWRGIGRFYGMYLHGASAAKGPGGWSDAFHREIGDSDNARDLVASNFTKDRTATSGTLDFDDRYQYRLIYSGEFTKGQWGINPYAVYEFYSNGLNGDAKDERTLYDVGFRGNYAFNQLMSVILDVDYAYQVRAAGVASGSSEETTPDMLKITPAFALSAGQFLSSRPTIRFYATYAMWNDDAKGDLSGIASRVDDSSYLKFGIQCEAWW